MESHSNILQYAIVLIIDCNSALKLDLGKSLHNPGVFDDKPKMHQAKKVTNISFILPL
jgi:hypothetical protein